MVWFLNASELRFGGLFDSDDGDFSSCCDLGVFDSLFTIISLSSFHPFFISKNTDANEFNAIFWTLLSKLKANSLAITIYI